MEQLRKYKIAVAQLDSQNNKKDNLEKVCRYIDMAAGEGTKIISFPEVMNLRGDNVGEGGESEKIPGYTTEILMKKAAEKKIYIHSGSFSEYIDGDSRGYNTSVVIDPEGNIICKYRKLHTFDVTLPDGTICAESEKIKPGDDIVTVDTPLGILGLCICYDIRFPELYRIMALRGAKVIFTPANFTMPTGKDHWETILRTRAIENGCYIVAADQMGRKKDAAFSSYGNSLIVDPWGTVIARSGDHEGVIYAEIDFDFLDSIRAKIPSLKNRRVDVYELNERR